MILSTFHVLISTDGLHTMYLTQRDLRAAGAKFDVDGKPANLNALLLLDFMALAFAPLAQLDMPPDSPEELDFVDGFERVRLQHVVAEKRRVPQ